MLFSLAAPPKTTASPLTPYPLSQNPKENKTGQTQRQTTITEPKYKKNAAKAPPPPHAACALYPFIC